MEQKEILEHEHIRVMVTNDLIEGHRTILQKELENLMTRITAFEDWVRTQELK